MTDPVEAPAPGRLAWWRAWLSWAGYAASGSAFALAAVLAAAAADGQRKMVGVEGAAWPAVGLLLAGAAFASATVPRWGRRLPSRVVSAGVWSTAALCLAGSCFVLLNLIELILTGTVTDPDGNSDWAGFGQRMGLAVVAALFLAAGLSWRRRTAGGCPRCGRVHVAHLMDRGHPPPHAAPPVVRRVAYAGCCAFVPYLALHTLGAAGYPGIEPDGYRPPWQALVLGYGGVALAVLLLLSLVRPWGMVYPRWAVGLAGRRVPRLLPLAVVWVVGPTLALYGLGSLVYVLLILGGAVDWRGQVGLLGVAAPVAFAGYGLALLTAALSYHRRTRPFCVGSTDCGGLATASR